MQYLYIAVSFRVGLGKQYIISHSLKVFVNSSNWYKVAMTTVRTHDGMRSVRTYTVRYLENGRFLSFITLDQIGAYMILMPASKSLKSNSSRLDPPTLSRQSFETFQFFHHFYLSPCKILRNKIGIRHIPWNSLSFDTSLVKIHRSWEPEKGSILP